MGIDLRKSNGELRETRQSMRRHHDEEIVRMEREHEEKILFLLRQLANKDPAESSSSRLWSWRKCQSCKTKKCVCKKNGKWCIVLCKCDIHTCANREVPGTDVSSSVETDKENE